MSGDYSNYEHQCDTGKWSKYQLMVLQQLEDHTKVLQNLNKEIITINQSIAVQQAENVMWKAQISANLKELRDEVDKILYDETGINHRIGTVERGLIVEEQSNIKTKAKWAFYGTIIAFVSNTIFQIIGTYLKLK